MLRKILKCLLRQRDPHGLRVLIDCPLEYYEDGYRSFPGMSRSKRQQGVSLQHGAKLSGARSYPFGNNPGRSITMLSHVKAVLSTLSHDRNLSDSFILPL